MKISYRNTKNVDIFLSLLMTKHLKIKILPPLYWISPTVLMLSPHVLMLSPNVLNTPTVLKLSPTVLMLSPHCTEQPPQYWRYPPQYWSYPPTCTAVIPPQYWRYPPHSTEGIPPQYWISPHSTEAIPPHVLLLSPHSIEGIPPQYWRYPPHSTEGIPPQYWISSTVLMLSLHSTDVIPTVLMLSPCMYWCYPPTVLNNLHSFEGIPPQFWRYPSTVLKLSLHSTEAIPHMYCCYPPTVLKVSLHSTEYPPQYWWYPPQYWCYPPACTDVIPPLYWTTSTILKLSPTVLMLSSDVLNNLQCTEQPPQYWTDVIWGVSVNSVRSLAHDSIWKIKLSIRYQRKPHFLTTMISRNWINTLTANLYRSKTLSFSLPTKTDWNSVSVKHRVALVFDLVSFSVWAVVLLHWRFHCTINHGAPWYDTFQWHVFERSISLINEYSM